MLVAGVLAGCSSSGGGATATSTSSSAPPTTPIPGVTQPLATVPGPTVTLPPGVTVPTVASDGSVPPTTVYLVAGQPCAPGSDPDCIDPEGDGTYVFLIGGAACMAGPLSGLSCSDLDGDGRAGYPDRG